MHSSQHPTFRVPRRKALLGVTPAVIALLVLTWSAPASAETYVPLPPAPSGEVSIVASPNDFYFAGDQTPVFGSVTAVSPASPVPTGSVIVESQEPGHPTYETELSGGDFFAVAYPSVAGTRQFTVAYSGDATFKPMSIVVDYFVPTGPDTMTTLRSDISGPITEGDSVTFTADVTDSSGRALDGPRFGEEIFFFVDGQPLEGDQVWGAWHSTLTTSSLAVGSRQVTAMSSAIFYDSSTSAPLEVTVVAAPGTPAGSLRGDVSAGALITERQPIVQAGAFPGLDYGRQTISTTTATRSSVAIPEPIAIREWAATLLGPSAPWRAVSSSAADCRAGTTRNRLIARAIAYRTTDSQIQVDAKE